MNRPFVIAISGGSGSGKTTLSRALKAHFKGRSVSLSLDNYYKDQSRLSMEKRALVNYDNPSSLDLGLFMAHMFDLREGKSVNVPQYDFSTHTRKKETVALAPQEFIFVDGLMSLCLKGCRKVYDYVIYVDADQDERLSRRLIRDMNERGRTLDSVLTQYFKTVKPMHEKFVAPHKEEADLLFVNNGNKGLDKEEIEKAIKGIEAKKAKLESRPLFIDAHAHLAHWPRFSDSVSYILSSMEEKGISFSLLSNCDCSEYPSVTTYGVHKIDQVNGLKALLKTVKKHKGRLGALAWINPHNEKATPEFERLILKNLDAIHGLKFHPWESQLRITSPKLKPYLRLARKCKLPILVHTAKDKYSDIRYLRKVALEYPDLNFIAAHLQLLGDRNEAIDAIKDVKNVYCDTAWVSLQEAQKALEALGKNRVLFGTDNPIDGERTLDNPLYEAYFENALKLPLSSYRSLMAKNAIRVYKIKIK